MLKLRPIALCRPARPAFAGPFRRTPLAAALLASSALAAAAADRTIDGTDARIDTGTVAYGTLLVGGIADASLSILTAATVDTATALLGETAGVAGAVYLRGGGTNWTSSGTLTAGKAGSGTIAIGEGATLDTADTVLGAEAGARGAVTVSGGGTVWTSTGTLTVGAEGSGSVVIDSGGAAAPFRMTLADALGSEGSVTVTGGGSTLTATGPTTVGGAGSGTLAVAEGGSASLADVVIGEAATGSGAVSVDRGGSSWISSGTLTIGRNGTGRFEITAGADAEVATTTLGEAAGAEGSLSVAGGGSTVTATGPATIGAAGTGSLTVAAAGAATLGDATLGAEAGGAGTLTVTGGGSTVMSTGTLTVGDAGTGTVSIAAGGAATAADIVLGAAATGAGSVLVTGGGSTFASSGTTTVGGAGEGTFTVAAGGIASLATLAAGADAGGDGTIRVTGGGSALAVSGAATIGIAGDGALQIDGGATVAVGGTLTLAAEAGSSGTLAIGGLSGATALSAGSLTTDALVFGAGDGTLVFNHAEDLYVFDVAVSGDGTIRAEGGTTLLSADNSGFTGTTTIAGATLLLDGTLGGAVTVEADGTLGGTSPGADAILGDLAVEAGATYRVVASEGGMTALDVGGLVALADGSLLEIVLDTPGGFMAGDSFAILSATGGVAGTFTLADPRLTAFLALELDSDGSAVTLDVVQDRAFVSAARTRNQIAVATAADTLPVGGALHTAILNLADEATARAAFDDLSGAVHGSVAAMLAEDGARLRAATTDRLRAARTLPPQGLAVWGSVEGAFGELASDGNAAGLSRRGGGFVAGLDAPLGEARIGALLGYRRTGFDVSGESASGTADTIELGLYGGGALGPVAVRLGAAYAHHAVETGRTVALPGLAETERADYGADSVQVFGEVGYAIAAGAVAFEPFLGLAAVSVSTDRFAEEGGEAALSGRASADLLFSTVGVRAAADFALGSVEGMIGWRHAEGDRAAAADLAFAGGGSAFTVHGAPVAADAFVADARLRLALGVRMAASLGYGLQLDGAALGQSLEARFTVDF